MTRGLFGTEPRLALALRAVWVLELPFDDAGEDLTRPWPWVGCSQDIHGFPTLGECQRGHCVNRTSMHTLRIDLASTAGGKSSSSIRAVNLLYAAMRAGATSVGRFSNLNDTFIQRTHRQADRSPLPTEQSIPGPKKTGGMLPRTSPILDCGRFSPAAATLCGPASQRVLQKIRPLPRTYPYPLGFVHVAGLELGDAFLQNICSRKQSGDAVRVVVLYAELQTLAEYGFGSGVRLVLLGVGEVAIRRERGREVQATGGVILR